MLLTQAVFQIACVFLGVYGVSAHIRTGGSSCALSSAIAVIGAAGFIVFWATWAFGEGGRWATAVPFCCAFLALALTASPKIETVIPIVIAAVASCCLYAFVQGNSDAPPLIVAGDFWTHSLPGDNGLPFIFAENIRNRVTGNLVPGWQSSDRPPLLSGLTLMAPLSLWRFDHYSYQAAAVAFQGFASLGVWSLVRSFSSARASTLCMIAAIFTPLYFVNSVFVWPKLLATSFLLCAIGLYFYGERRSAIGGVLVGTLCALAMLSHGVSAFVLIAMALSAVFLWLLPSPRYAASALAVALVLYTPWVIYQQKIDPPGDRLTKWHLAGVQNVDPRSTTQAIKDEYAKLSWSEIIDRRIGNAKRMTLYFQATLSNTMSAALDSDNAATILKQVRVFQFFGVMASIGIFGSIFFVVWIGLFFGPSRPLAAVIVLSLLAWWAFLFEPNSAVNHQGSFVPQFGAIAMFGFFAERFWLLCSFVVFASASITVYQYSL